MHPVHSICNGRHFRCLSHPAGGIQCADITLECLNLKLPQVYGYCRASRKDRIVNYASMNPFASISHELGSLIGNLKSALTPLEEDNRARKHPWQNYFVPLYYGLLDSAPPRVAKSRLCDPLGRILFRGCGSMGYRVVQLGG